MRISRGLWVVAVLLACPGAGDEGTGGPPDTGSGDPSPTSPTTPTPTDGGVTDGSTGPAPTSVADTGDTSNTTPPATGTDTTESTDTTVDTDTTDTGPVNGDSLPIDPLPAPLIVWVDPGPGGKDPYLPLLAGPGGALVHPLSPPALAGTTLEDLQERASQAQTAYEYGQDYARCQQEQGDTAACVKKVVWQGLCNWAVGKLTERMSPAMQMIGFPYEAICNGEPALKCCIYTDSDGCHSAYNSDMPINCEGNPIGGMSYGPCISENPADIFTGCTCGYLAECSGGDAPIGDPSDRAGRLDKAARQLAAALPGLAVADPNGFLNFVTLQGTRDYTDALAILAPFSGPDELPPNLADYAAYHANDDDPRSRYLRALTTTAVRRVIGGLPNSLDRWDHVLARTWDDASKAAWLDGIADPEADLLAALGPFGLAIIKTAYPDTYLLLAAPTPTETPDPDASKYLAGVEAGAAPTLSFGTAAIDGASVTLALALDDPNAADNPDGTYLVGVDWGDNVFEGVAYAPADPATAQISHTYAAPGSYEVRMWTDNTAGLVSGAGATISVDVGAGDPHPRAVEAVTLELRAAATAGQHGSFSVHTTGFDAGAFSHPLGRAWVAVTGPANAPAAADFPAYAMTHGDRVPLPRLQLRAVHEGAVDVTAASVLLDAVTVTHYTSAGQDPLVVTYPAADLEITVGDDPPVVLPVEDGAVALPLDADVRVVLPTP